VIVFVFFFFQAEDGIRDRNVTGVQTVLFRSWHLLQGGIYLSFRLYFLLFSFYLVYGLLIVALNQHSWKLLKEKRLNLRRERSTRRSNLRKTIHLKISLKRRLIIMEM